MQMRYFINAVSTLLEVAPDARLRGLKLYHGTPTTRQADGILKHGLHPDQQTNYTHQLRPTAGHVYLSTDPYYAIKYALGENARRRSASEYADRFCYVFVFSGRDLTHIVPDEDSIGDFLWQHTIPNPTGGRGKTAWHYDTRWNLAEDEDAHRQVWNFLFQQATPKELRGCCTLGPNRPYAWAAFGKRMQDRLPEWIALKLIEWGAHVAHGGAILPRDCWQLDRSHQQEVANYPTRFFELARRLGVPKF
jgi:hypothetical protein